MTTLVETAEIKRQAHEGTRDSSVNRAVLYIRNLIVQGRMAPGAWVVEEKLSEQLNMSRTPVRLALYLLRSEGYVTEQRSREKSHMIVAPLTREDAADLYLILGRLEGLAGRRAADLPLTERTALVSRLKDLNNQLAELAAPDTATGPEILETHRRFHRLLIDAGSGPRLKSMYKAIEPQAERYWRIYSTAILRDLPAWSENMKRSCLR